MIKSLSAAMLAATLIAAPASAQTSRAAPSAAAMKAAMEFGKTEQDYGMQTGMTGAVALRTSEIAVRQASNPMVKSFAESEVMEQSTLSKVLMEHSQMAGRPLPPPQPDPAMAGMITQLQAARGADFDRMYIRGQIDGHEKLLTIQENYIRSGRNAHLKHVAMLARGHIMDHLKALRTMEGQIRTASR